MKTKIIYLTAYNYKLISYFFLAIVLFLFSCKGNNNDPNLTLVDNTPISPYDDPICHPSGQVIGFNHIPIKEIHYLDGYNHPRQATYSYKMDSIGFWLINTDGTNMRRILPYYLNTPAWSPDGKQIAFSRGGQICIMPFDGERFDTTNVKALTYKGNNSRPAWSSDAKKIAFSESICSETMICGIWIYDFETNKSKNVVIYGDYPSWFPFSNSLICSTNALDDKGNDIGDSFWLYNNETNFTHLLKYLSLPNYVSRELKYSSDGTKIGFISALSSGGGFQFYSINNDGSEMKKITSDGCLNFSWLPNGKIIYVNFDEYRIDETKGTVWMMDADGSSKKPLTYNKFEIKQ